MVKYNRLKFYLEIFFKNKRVRESVGKLLLIWFLYVHNSWCNSFRFMYLYLLRDINECSSKIWLPYSSTFI